MNREEKVKQIDKIIEKEKKKIGGTFISGDEVLNQINKEIEEKYKNIIPPMEG